MAAKLSSRRESASSRDWPLHAKVGRLWRQELLWATISLRILRFENRVFKTVLSSGYILILLSIENILASLIETCQGWSRMRNVK